MYALEVKNLKKQFENVTAVDGVSFTVPEGAIFGLIGRNGAGKTTTLRMIMNIFLPDDGEVFVRGVRAGQEFRERTGYLPEERGLYKKLKVLETILFFAELKNKRGKEIEKEAERYLRRFDLWDRRNSKLEDLSKGNQQKIQFIATIIHDPDFIVLDEPFSGMDPINTELIKEIILELKEKRKIIIFSTHLMDFAERLCDTIAMIDHGKVILHGGLAEIKERFAQRNISVSHEGDIGFLRENSMIESFDNFGRRTTLKVRDNAHVQEILKLLVEKNIPVHSFVANEITLHEIFIALAGGDHSNGGGNV